MSKIYILTEGNSILKFAKTAKEVLDYRNTFSLPERLTKVLGLIIPPVPVAWKEEAWRWN